MKTFYSIIFLVLFGTLAHSQAPESFDYQAVIRNASGDILANTQIAVQISFLQDSESGSAVYVERFNPTTTEYGMIDIKLGNGSPQSGTFSAIDWGAHAHYMKVEVDPNNGTDFTTLGTSQLLSVPYSLHSKSAENVFTGDYNDLTNKPLLFDGTWESLSSKPTTLAGYGITDGMNTTHPANGITSGLIANWNAAFGWGDHDGLYRPIGYVPAWSEITGKPTFAPVATSGSYTDLINTPTILNSQWTTLGSNIYYNTGRVGIGTDNPNYALQVHTSSGVSYVQISDNTNENGGLRVGLNGTGSAYILNDNANGGLMLGTEGGIDVSIDQDGNTVFREEVQHQSVGTAHLLPVAYGMVSAAGVRNDTYSTNNFSVSRISTGRYRIDVNGFDSHPFIPVANAYGGGSQDVVVSIQVIGSDGTFDVRCYDISSAANVDMIFVFVVYRP